MGSLLRSSDSAFITFPGRQLPKKRESVRVPPSARENPKWMPITIYRIAADLRHHSRLKPRPNSQFQDRRSACGRATARRPTMHFTSPSNSGDSSRRFRCVLRKITKIPEPAGEHRARTHTCALSASVEEHLMLERGRIIKLRRDQRGWSVPRSREWLCIIRDHQGLSGTWGTGASEGCPRCSAHPNERS